MSPSVKIGRSLRLCGATLLMLISCVFPTDESKSVFVTIEQASRIVNRGGTLVLRARAWLSAEDGTVRSLDGATFAWQSSDPSVASVQARADGQGTITGIRSGAVRVNAVPIQFEKATSGSAEVRVANIVEIDSTVPKVVRYGQQLTLYGVGLGRMDRVFLGVAPLIPDGNSLAGDSAGLGSMRFWVPFPASSQQVLAAVAEGFSATSPDTVVVVPEDVYETRDTLPVLISLDGPTIRDPDVLFFNPALSIEVGRSLSDSALAMDNFHFTWSNPSQSLTVILKSSALPVGHLSAEMYSYLVPDDGWVIDVVGTRTDSVIHVLEAGTTSSFRLDIRGEEGPYSIEVRAGEPAAFPATPADRFEYNDHRGAALRNQEEEGRRIDLSAAAFEEELSIHRPHDIDWYSFDVGTFEAGVVSISVIPLPAGAVDSSDIDLFVAGAASATPGSSFESVQFETSFLSSYDVVVFDAIGVPTRYLLCISLGTVCAGQGISRQEVAAPHSARVPRAAAGRTAAEPKFDR